MITMMITNSILTGDDGSFIIDKGLVISSGIDISYFVISRVFGFNDIDTNII